MSEEFYRFSYRPYRLRFRQPLRTAHGLWSEREGVLVRLADDQGRVGYGEIAPIPEFGTESLADALWYCGSLGTRVEQGQLEAIAGRHSCCQFAFHSAKRALLGTAFPPGLESLPIAALLPAGTAALEVLDRRAVEGHRTFKWKVAVGGIDEELKLLERLAGVLPEGGRLRLDANGGWTRSEAELWLRTCEDFPVEFVEQPLSPADQRGLLGLAESHAVPLALDESVTRLDELKKWLDCGWRGLFVIKPALAGPPDAVWSELRQPGVRAVFSTAIETAVGARAALEFAFAASAAPVALGFGVGDPFEEPGWAFAPAHAGLRHAEVAKIDPGALWNRLES